MTFVVAVVAVVVDNEESLVVSQCTKHLPNKVARLESRPDTVLYVSRSAMFQLQFLVYGENRIEF